MILRRRDRASDAPATERATPPDGARHLLVIVLDSLRYDSWTRADPKQMGRLGNVERRFSYASWTAPSHYNLLMGLLPHTSPTGVYASEYYKQDFTRYQDRLAIPDIEFRKLLPSIFMPKFLQSLGYRTHAMVSMPVLNEQTLLNNHFDTYRLMPKHNDMAAMLDELRFDEGPSFHLLNVGETHYPYALPDEDPSEWPRISGAHGVLKTLDDATVGEAAFFDQDQMEKLRDRQVRAVTYLDSVMEKVFDLAPPDTWIILTSDHGELFGEGNYFGHGPVAHEKVFEVPFVEGQRP